MIGPGLVQGWMIGMGIRPSVLKARDQRSWAWTAAVNSAGSTHMPG